jgi:hypothetical protein
VVVEQAIIVGIRQNCVDVGVTKDREKEGIGQSRREEGKRN